MTVQQFANYSPAPGSINFYYSGTTVSAITVSSVDCNGNNVARSLSELTSVRVSISGTSYLLTITNVTSKNNYYFYTIEPVTVSSVSDKNCTNSLLTPSPSETSFNSSDYNVLINNASSNTTTGYIYDVDRTTLSARPVNYLSIMSGSATTAEYQELNYSSIGLTNSRYVGTKTSIVDYGVASSFTATPFDAATYLSSSTNNYICSQSLSDRNVKEYLYTGNLEYPSSGSRIFKLDGNKVIPLRNRKVWGSKTNTIYYVDETGYVIESSTSCTV